MRVGNSPLLSSRLRRGSSHLEKASLPRQTPRIGSYSNRDASSALTVAAAAAPPSPLLLLAAPSTRCPRSFILYPPPFIQVRRQAPAAAGTAEVTAGGAVPSPSPAPCGHRGRSVCVCLRRSGVPCPPSPCPAVPARTTHQPLALHLGLGQQRRAGSWHGIRQERVCARWACRSRLQRAAGRAERCGAERPGAAGCQPGPERCRRTVPGQK